MFKVVLPLTAPAGITHLLKEHTMQTVEQRMAVERKVVRHLIRALKAKGWLVQGVDDGGAVWIKPTTEAATMDAVFAVDTANIRFVNSAGITHIVVVVLGNDGYDALADWGFAEGDADGFNAAMEEVSAYCSTLEPE